MAWHGTEKMYIPLGDHGKKANDIKGKWEELKRRRVDECLWRTRTCPHHASSNVRPMFHTQIRTLHQLFFFKQERRGEEKRREESICVIPNLVPRFCTVLNSPFYCKMIHHIRQYILHSFLHTPNYHLFSQSLHLRISEFQDQHIFLFFK